MRWSAIRAPWSTRIRNRRGRMHRGGGGHAVRGTSPDRSPSCHRRHHLAAAGRSADVLLRRTELRGAHRDGGEAQGRRARAAGEARRGRSRPQRPHRPSRPHRPPTRRDGAGGVRRRARLRHRTHREAPHARRRALVPARIHHRERRERTFVAGAGSDAVAGEEHRHVQADGSVDRDRFRPRRGHDPGPGERPAGHRVPHRPDDLRCRRLPRRDHEVHHPAPRRRAVDGHRGARGSDQGRGCRRHRDHRHRNAEQSGDRRAARRRDRDSRCRGGAATRTTTA